METDRFDELEALFVRALALPADQRSSVLDAAALADPALRAELAALLEAHEGASDFFVRLAADLPFPLPEPEPPPMADPLIGQAVGPYLILERLGEGGMGVVYRAEDTRLRRSVALKFLAPDRQRDQAAVRRFRHEAQAAAALDHPNICTIYEVGEADDGRLFIAMAYCPGETLQARLRRGALPLDAALGIARQMAHGLAKAHAEGIVHRDVKPGNIMILPEGLLKIVDFGLAKRDEIHLTRTGTTMGTVAYMSPEQARGEPVGAASDVWAVGVVLYEMLAGLRPFRASYDQAVLYAILHDPPEPLSVHRPDCPPALGGLIRACLQKNPADRPSDAAALANALDALATGNPLPPFGVPPAPEATTASEASGPSTGSSLFETLSHLSREEKALGAGVLVALVLVLMLVPGRELFDRVLGGMPAGYHLAVLPFAALGEGGDAAFDEGLRLAVTRLLTEMRPDAPVPLRVVPAFEVEAGFTTADAHARLGVDQVLSGTVVREGATVRLELALVDARTHDQLRTAVVTAPVGQGAALQAGLVGGVAEVLGLALSAPVRERLTAKQTGNARAYGYYLKGIALLEHPERPENIDAARRLLGFALDEDPGYALAHAALGRAYWTAYDDTKDTTYLPLAQYSAERALALDDRLPEAHITLGQLAYGRGNDQAAISAYTLALALDPTHAEAYRRIALSYERLGRDHDAEAYYRKAIDARPDYYRPYNWLGIYYAQRQRYDEAVAAFEQVVALLPEEVRGYNNLGYTYLTKGDYAEARRWYENALRLQPNYTTYLNLGAIAYHEGDYEGEARMYEQALALDSTGYRVWGNLASAYYTLSDPRADAHYRRAIAKAETAFRVNPTQAGLRDKLGTYHYMRGKLALQAARPDDALDRLAVALRYGYDPAALAADSALTDLHEDRRFRQLLAASGPRDPP